MLVRRQRLIVRISSSHVRKMEVARTQLRSSRMIFSLVNPSDRFCTGETKARSGGNSAPK